MSLGGCSQNAGRTAAYILQLNRNGWMTREAPRELYFNSSKGVVRQIPNR